ncbi:MAG: alkaline phosphatase family protein [Flavisolibacter sp.]|nr:alkaline phosphatase family protein [Flavisolibacter sp.]MBD0365953.1 alkaline phosphatase family protein [Flavisolibacter sp.]
MKRIVLLLQLVILTVCTPAQTIERPKLIVGIVVDQMRWDYLYRYFDRYAANGGFKRMLRDGFSCENTLINYTPSVTACGHASIYTGSVPAIHGITGNTWIDRQSNQVVYCTEDKTVKTIGSNTASGLMSPANLLTTTISDELRLATNFRSKVIGIALKDRGSILPAGHKANAAYWYDIQTGDWITSSYYGTDLPKWVKDFNAKKPVDKYYAQDWNTLYPVNTYAQSTADDKPYEAKPLGKTFPYSLKQFAGKNYSIITVTPYGNSLTTEFAKAAITAEGLGTGNSTDLLAISYSSTDYVGHTFGPNSIEAEDVFLRMDKELGELLDFLDSKIGKNQYLVFLSADHGVVQAPGFLQENSIPAGSFSADIVGSLNSQLRQQFGRDRIIGDAMNYQLHLNRSVIDSFKLNEKEIINAIIRQSTTIKGIARAIDITQLRNATLNQKVQEMLINGYFPNRSGDIQLIFAPQWIEGYTSGGTTHGLWNPYDTHIPLLWYGWGIKAGKTNREIYITDIAPTLAALLHIQMPSGCVGVPIEEVRR